MKIGIDAKWYFEGPPSGKRVVKGLVDHILKTDDVNEYFIFLDKKHQKEDFAFKGNKNVTLCYVWAKNNFISNVFVLPFHSNRYKLGALLYQNFVSPFDKAKRVAYIHDVLFLSNPEYYTIFERLYFSPLRFLTKRSDLIITVSVEEKKRLLKFGFSENASKIVVAYHGVDSSFCPIEEYPAGKVQEIKQKFGLPDVFLLYVGRLNLRKNVDNLLKAIPHLKNTTIPLVIVGADNWKKSNHWEIISSLKIEKRVHFTGAVYKELGVIYAMAKVFCFPSYAESFGLPPLEAMASGVPIVVSNTTSLPEICGNAGSYIQPDSPDQIAKAIDDLLLNDQFYAKQRLLGLEQAKKFTWDGAAKVVVDSIIAIGKN